MRTGAGTGGADPEEAESLTFGGHPRGARRAGAMDPSSKVGLSLFKETVSVRGPRILKNFSPLQNPVRSVVKRRERRTRITSPDEDEGGGGELFRYNLEAGTVVLRL